MILFILFHFFLIIFAKDDCSSSSPSPFIYVEMDEVVFFTEALDALSCRPKYIYFQFNTTDYEHIQYYIAYRNFDGLKYSPFKVDVQNDTIYSAKTEKYLFGHIIFNDLGNINCPLESISRINPYKFKNENQVLYLSNEYNGINSSISPCKWQFSAPHGYGFKVVIEMFEFDFDTKFIVENRTKILIDEHLVKLYDPIYTSDSYLQIQLFNTKPNLRFRGYVAIVPNTSAKKGGNCSFSNVTNIWGNYDGKTLYRNNEECFFYLTILPYTKVIITFPHFIMGEIAVDYIGYYDENMNFVKMEFDVPQSTKGTGFTLSPYKNETEKHVLWKYVSDGSIPGFGFQLKFQVLNCTCANKVIPCGKKGTIIENSAIYCRNMNCEFELEPCETDYLRLYMYFSSDFYLVSPDLFQMFSNDSLIFQIPFANSEQNDYFVLLNSANKNVLRVTTFEEGNFFFKLSSIDDPAFQKAGSNLNFGYAIEIHLQWFQKIPVISERVLLTIDKPSYIADVMLHKIILIEISEELKSNKYAFRVHQRYVNDIFLYNDESLTDLLKEQSCKKDPLHSSFFSCTYLNIKKFVIFLVSDDSEYPYVAVQVINITKNCVFEKMIYQQEVPPEYIADPRYSMADYSKKFIISAIANPDQSCMVTFLLDSILDYIHYMTHVWTTSKNEKVKVFSGIYQNLTLFEFNTASQNYWKDIQLSSPIYSIEIPKNSSIYIVISNVPITNNDDSGAALSNVYVSQFPYYSLITTASLGISQNDFWRGLPQNFYISKFAVKFTAKYINLSEDDTIWLQVNSTNFNFNQTGDSYIFRNELIFFDYSRPATDPINKGAIIMIETLNDTNF